MAYQEPSRTKRTVVMLGVEQTPGTLRIAGLEQIPIYGSFNPVQAEADTIPLDRARNGLGPEGFGIAAMSYREQASIYPTGSGYANFAPPWTRLLRACGWTETRYATDDGGLVSDDVNTDLTITAGGTGGSLTAQKYAYKISIIGKSTHADVPLAESFALAHTSAITVTSAQKVTFKATTGALSDSDVAYVCIYRTKAVDIGGDPTGAYYLVAKTTPAVLASTDGYVDNLPNTELVDPLPTDLVANPDAWVGTDPCIVYVPANSAHTSLTLRNYLNSRQYPACGVRGTMTFEGTATQLFRGDCTLQGVYNDSVAQGAGGDNPCSLVNPGIPPRVVAIAAGITKQGGALYTPRVTRVGVNLGTNVTRRLDGNADSGIIEYGIFNEFAPRVTMTVEVEGPNGDSTLDWIKSFKDSDEFKVSFVISSQGISGPRGSRLKFVADGDGTTFGCQLASPPQFDDSEGIRVFNLEFVPKEVEGTGCENYSNFLKLVHY